VGQERRASRFPGQNVVGGRFAGLGREGHFQSEVELPVLIRKRLGAGGAEDQEEGEDWRYVVHEGEG
jgi:hypothetical protein